jgi:hypothetical protein
MLRTFGQQTLTGVAQPIFGDKTTAPTNYAVSTGLMTIPVTSTVGRYQANDVVIVGYGTASAISVTVQSLDATHLYAKPTPDATVFTYGANTQLALSLAAMDITIQTSSTAVNPVWLGADQTVTSSGGGSVASQILPASFFRLTYNGQSNTVRSTDAWMAGTAGDQVICTAIIL